MRTCLKQEAMPNYDYYGKWELDISLASHEKLNLVTS